MKRTTDTRAQYQLAMDEEGILLAAANILERRLLREGALTDPNAAANYLKARPEAGAGVSGHPVPGPHLVLGGNAHTSLAARGWL